MCIASLGPPAQWPPHVPRIATRVAPACSHYRQPPPPHAAYIASVCHARHRVLVCYSLPAYLHHTCLSYFTILSSAEHRCEEATFAHVYTMQTDYARVPTTRYCTPVSARTVAALGAAWRRSTTRPQRRVTASPEIQACGGAVWMRTCAVWCAHGRNACCGCSMDG